MGSRRLARSGTQHDSTHRKSDIIMLLPTASTLSNTSSSGQVACCSAGSLVRSIEAGLWQLSSSRVAKVSSHATSTRPKRSRAADPWFMNERPCYTNSKAAPLIAHKPSSGIQTVHCNDAFNSQWFLPEVLCRYDWFVPSPPTIRGRVCDPATLLDTRSLDVITKSPSGRSRTLARMHGTLCRRHCITFSTRNISRNN